MKGYLTLVLMAGMCVICYGQTNTFPTSGNVGIGTTSPAAELHLSTGTIQVDGTSPTLYLRGGSTGEKGRVTLNHYGHLSWDLVSGDAANGAFSISPTGTSDNFVINSTGNIGIGTASPSSLLHIVKGVSPTITIESNTNSNAYLTLKGGGSGSLPYRIFSTGSGSYLGAGKFVIADEDTGYEAFIINGGNVGIGTTTIPSGYKLAVDGNIIAEAVKVQLSGSWPDHVFESGHKLPDLSETEQYIKENKHLPEIPSAKEVAETGINLGEMNAKLLQKIEELTLYIIDQNKRIEKLEEEKK